MPIKLPQTKNIYHSSISFTIKNVFIIVVVYCTNLSIFFYILSIDDVFSHKITKTPFRGSNQSNASILMKLSLG